MVGRFEALRLALVASEPTLPRAATVVGFVNGDHSVARCRVLRRAQQKLQRSRIDA
jgi:hypothetical protein